MTNDELTQTTEQINQAMHDFAEWFLEEQARPFIEAVNEFGERMVATFGPVIDQMHVDLWWILHGEAARHRLHEVRQIMRGEWRESTRRELDAESILLQHALYGRGKWREHARRELTLRIAEPEWRFIGYDDLVGEETK